MQQQDIPIGTLIDTYKRWELRFPEVQRHYVWRATRVAKQGEETLQSQCVPVGETLWSTDCYSDFLSVRRQAPADRMNAFVPEKSET